MVRFKLSALIEENDTTLVEVNKKCYSVALLCYAGNISSVLLAPIIYKKLRDLNSSFDIYEHNIFLYANDDVLQLDHRIYLVVSLIDANTVVKTVGKTVYNILSTISERYYYDSDNVVFTVRVPEKFIDDYIHILSSEYTKVSTHYKELCDRDDLALAVFNNSSTVYNQWKKYEELIGLVKHPKKADSEPAKIVTTERNFPEFNLLIETYYAERKHQELRNKEALFNVQKANEHSRCNL